MPKLKDIARFTTPVNINDTKDTPVKNVPPQFRSAVLNTQRQKQTFIHLLNEILIKQTQPLSVLEVAELASREAGRAYDATYIRISLNQLVDAGKVSHRKETSNERTIRENGKPCRGLSASLYWAPAGPVPPRTVAEAVPGMTLRGDTGRVYRKVYKYSQGYKKKAEEHLHQELAEFSSVVTDLNTANANPVIDYLIEKMVQDRTLELQAKLDASEAELARLRNFLKSAIQ
jgi:hypothetical protein